MSARRPGRQSVPSTTPGPQAAPEENLSPGAAGAAGALGWCVTLLHNAGEGSLWRYHPGDRLAEAFTFLAVPGPDPHATTSAENAAAAEMTAEQACAQAWLLANADPGHPHGDQAWAGRPAEALSTLVHAYRSRGNRSLSTGDVLVLHPIHVLPPAPLDLRACPHANPPSTGGENAGDPRSDGSPARGKRRSGQGWVSPRAYAVAPVGFTPLREVPAYEPDTLDSTYSAAHIAMRAWAQEKPGRFFATPPRGR